MKYIFTWIANIGMLTGALLAAIHNFDLAHAIWIFSDVNWLIHYYFIVGVRKDNLPHVITNWIFLAIHIIYFLN